MKLRNVELSEIESFDENVNFEKRSKVKKFVDNDEIFERRMNRKKDVHKSKVRVSRENFFKE